MLMEKWLIFFPNHIGIDIKGTFACLAIFRPKERNSKITGRGTGVHQDYQLPVMSDYNEKADLIDQVLRYLIQQTSEVQNPPSEYAMYIDPALSDTWLLVVYFPDLPKLRKALQTGLCYNIHKFLKGLLEAQEGLKEDAFHIVFDHGQRPQTEDEAVAYFGGKYRQLDVLTHSQPDASGNCPQCGHPMEEHQMLGIPNENSASVEEGWIICPNENCTCFHTWGVKYDNSKKA